MTLERFHWLVGELQHLDTCTALLEDVRAKVAALASCTPGPGLELHELKALADDYRALEVRAARALSRHYEALLTTALTGEEVHFVTDWLNGLGAPAPS